MYVNPNNDLEIERTNHVQSLLQSGNTDAAIAYLSCFELSLSLRFQLVHSVAVLFDDLKFAEWVMQRSKDDFQLPMPWVDSPKSHSVLQQCLYQACQAGSCKIVRLLVEEYGADVDGLDMGREGQALNRAVASENIELIRYVLTLGSKPNHTSNDCHASYDLMLAAYKNKLEIVKLLVEYGALVNSLNLFGLSPLSYAQMGGDQEMIDYLKSVGALEPWQILGVPPPVLPEPSKEPKTLARHMMFQSDVSDYGGVAAQDSLRPDWPIQLHRYSTLDGVFLLTEGMSQVPLAIPGPDESEECSRCELYLRLFLLPYVRAFNEWPDLTPDQVWIAEWLFKLARYPAVNGHWLGQAAILMNEEPPLPMAEGFPFTGWLLVSDPAIEINRWERTPGDVVRLYQAIPIYTSERDYERTHGLPALIDLLNKAEVFKLSDLERPPVA